jgi:hypothetical protein
MPQDPPRCPCSSMVLRDLRDKIARLSTTRAGTPDAPTYCHGSPNAEAVESQHREDARTPINRQKRGPIQRKQDSITEHTKNHGVPRSNKNGATCATPRSSASAPPTAAPDARHQIHPDLRASPSFSAPSVMKSPNHQPPPPVPLERHRLRLTPVWAAKSGVNRPLRYTN